MSIKPTYHSLFIDGTWTEPTSGKTAETINPATGQPIVSYALANAEDVSRATLAAQRAYEEDWNDRIVSERAGYLYRLADVIEAQTEEFAYLESIDTGKPLTLATDEIGFIADTFRFFAGVARNPEGKSAQEYQEGVTSMIRREPLGVTVGICPWNFPFMMLAWKLAPALAAGNTSIIKPASETPLTALHFAEAASDILPPGVLNVITGRGSELGDALCNRPEVRLVSMTGSTETGKKIAQACAGGLKRVHLELGGKAPVVVFDDANIDSFINTMKEAAFTNSGQDCGQPCRVIAQANVYDEVVERLTQAASELVVGDPMNENTQMGPVISSARCEEVHGFVERAVAAGATVQTGGSPLDLPGAFYAPTVLTDVEQSAEVVQQEIFGPVITVQRFDTEAQALAMANDVIYGLGSSVWTRDTGRAMRMSRRMQFGAVWVNTHFVQPMEMPWGGYKQSGYGKDESGYAFEDYTQIKHVGIAY